ncbi:MAG: pSer/pThr/pTyr-binding forkhead associated (FHA) protein [Candidatus Omnitrophota bacterium]|jgi:pSer/pThr/pTyr-binding forkhead associated (FHA) protein
MGAALIVTRDKKQTNKTVLDKPLYTLGRSVKCDLVLDDDNISRQNTQIRTDERGQHILEDLGSRNGTIIKGRPITKERVLKSGDKFLVGPYEVLYLVDEYDIPEDATRGIDDVKLAAAKAHVQAGRSMPGGLHVKLVAEAGPLKGTDFENWQGDLSIGRHVDNDVVIPDDSVSNFHTVIRFGPQGYEVEDLGSANGTFVKGIRVSRQTLREKENIRIGTTRFSFSAINRAKKKRTQLIAFVTFIVVLLAMAAVKKMMPEPAWKSYMNMAVLHIQKGEYAQAQVPLQEVIQLDPGNNEAVMMLTKCKELVQISELEQAMNVQLDKDLLEDARKSAGAILDVSPGHPMATKINEGLTALLDAKVAGDNQNWASAIELLTQAEDMWPERPLIKDRLAMYKVELQSQEHHKNAKILARSGTRDNLKRAVEHLEQVPKDSVYYTEASALLSTLNASYAGEQAVHLAQQAYQDGDLAKVEQILAASSSVLPSEPRLQAILKKTQAIRPLHDQLMAMNVAKMGTDLAQLRKAIALSDQATTLLADPVNKMQIRFAAVGTQARSQLKQVATTYLQAGNQAQKANDLQGAAQAFVRAAEADPTLAAAKTALETLTDAIGDQVKGAYQEGLLYKEVGEKAKAMEKFKEVMQGTWPEHPYYIKAQREISTF